MVLSLLYGRKYPRSRVGTVLLDATILEEHRYASRVTSYPVETANEGNSTIISDHIINEPDILVLQGIVTDTPINILAPSNRSIDAFNQLVRIHQNREVITVITGLKVYRDMAITSLDVPRTMKTGQSLTFNIEMQKITFSASIRLSLDQGTPFGGIQNKKPREIIARNEDYPLIQDDPEGSLKDQAQSGIDVGVQSLQDVPIASLPRITAGALQILGVA